MKGDFEVDGMFTLDGEVEATRLSLHFGNGNLAVSDADKKPPKKEVILFPFLQDMLSALWDECVSEGIRYSFSGNSLGVYVYQFRGEGDCRHIKDWSLVATYRKAAPLIVEIRGTTHPDVVHFLNGKYGDGPTTVFSAQFEVRPEILQDVLGMNDIRFGYFTERLKQQL